VTGPVGKREPESPLHRRRPGIRLIYSAIAIVGGVILALPFAGGATGDSGSTPVFIGALVVIGLGLISIPAFLWMDRRGL
jgi:hypothetical protein